MEEAEPTAAEEKKAEEKKQDEARPVPEEEPPVPLGVKTEAAQEEGQELLESPTEDVPVPLKAEAVTLRFRIKGKGFKNILWPFWLSFSLNNF